MRNKTRYCLGVVIAFVGVIGIVIGSMMLLASPTQAAGSAIINKAMAYGIYGCYKDGHIIDKISLQDYDGIESIVSSGGSITLPTGYYNVNSVNCAQLIGGNWNSDFKGAASINGINIPVDNINGSSVSGFLTGMGFSEKKADGGKCVSYVYKYGTPNNYLDSDSSKVLKMCATVDSKGNITSDRVDVSGDDTVVQIEVKDKAVQLDCSQFAGYGGCEKHTFKPGETNFEVFAGEILGDLEKNRSSGVCEPFTSKCWRLINELNIESRGDVLASFEFHDRAIAGQKAMKYLTGYDGLSATKLTEVEKINLLQGYLRDYYKIDNYGCDLDSSQQNIAKGAGYTEFVTNMFSGGGYQTCWVKPDSKTVNNSVAVYNSQGYFDGTQMNYNDVIKALSGTVTDLFEDDKRACTQKAARAYNEASNILRNPGADEDLRNRAQRTKDELDQIKKQYGEYWYEENGAIYCPAFTDIGGQTVETPTNTTQPPSLPSNTTSGGSSSSTTTSSDLEQCFNNASSLGWILCPVLKFVGSAADKLWEEMSSNWLIVNSDEYKANDSSTAYRAWSFFRNFANIAFVIFLTVVIISQLSGIGITNYGIKKLLPSLIIMAVLVNLSYFICQILIDVSNIVGASIGGIFTNVQSAISPSSSVGAGDVVRGFLGTLLNAVGIAGVGISLGVILKLQGLAAMIPVLIAVLGLIISVIFVFLILAIRQAGILVMVIISPLAIICYSLPNAKNLFDKWKKLFTSLLFVYPVCSACIYGGQLVSSIMLGSDNTSFMYNLVGMLLQIVPIFFIPSLIRGSLALAGNIGNRVSQLGKGLSNRATGALRKSEAVDRFRTSEQFRAAQRNRELFNRLSKKGGVLKKIGEYGGRRMDSAVARYNKMRLDERQAQLYGNSINEDSINRSLASLERKDMERRIAEDVDDIIRGDAIDTTDAGKINDAFKAALAEVDADPTDETKMIRAKALASLLMGKGDTGQSMMIESMRNHTYATTGVNAQGSEAMRALGGYISYNDKWMASIKGKDTGGYKFMNDLASSQTIKSADKYAMAGAEKVTQATIGGMGDSWYNSIQNAINNNSFNTDNASREALHTYADMATKALTDPRYAGTIQKERLKTLNELRKKDYEMRQADWLAANTGKTAADYEKEFGKFQNINNPGDKLVVPHTRMAVPTGWTESGVWIGGNGGPTRQQQIAYEEWARHAAEIDRLNSQSQP